MTRRPRPSVVPHGPVLRRRAEERHPLALAVLAATGYLEARAGCRDIAQLTDLVDRRTARLLVAMVRRRRRGPDGPIAITLRRVVMDGTRPHRPSFVVLLDRGDRVVPVCVEVRRVDDDWTVTTLSVPDDHRPTAPDPTEHRPDWEEPASVEPW